MVSADNFVDNRSPYGCITSHLLNLFLRYCWYSVTNQKETLWLLYIVDILNLKWLVLFAWWYKIFRLGLFTLSSTTGFPSELSVSCPLKLPVNPNNHVGDRSEADDVADVVRFTYQYWPRHFANFWSVILRQVSYYILFNEAT